MLAYGRDGLAGEAGQVCTVYSCRERRAYLIGLLDQGVTKVAMQHVTARARILAAVLQPPSEIPDSSTGRSELAKLAAVSGLNAELCGRLAPSETSDYLTASRYLH